jgi:hypothetical protein
MYQKSKFFGLLLVIDFLFGILKYISFLSLKSYPETLIINRKQNFKK